MGPSTRSDEDEPPQSVIHAPPGFGDFVGPQVRVVTTLADDGDSHQAAMRPNFEGSEELQSPSIASEQADANSAPPKTRKVISPPFPVWQVR